ncbi:unnamed protein product [Mytilus coruscus]|uniref:Uncharacterized protein n=1 Tax=Mytilus coruscus TaxID=42192 RepID=A0A6J8A516_MYTCO|nr:unnamed protein product [Mytilus coruscus]
MLNLPDDEDENLINDQSPVSFQKEVDINSSSEKEVDISSSEVEPMYQFIDDSTDLDVLSKVIKKKTNIVLRPTKHIFESREDVLIVDFNTRHRKTNRKTADKATESYLAQLESKINVDNQNIDDGGIRHSAAEKPITETIPLTKENSDNFSVDEHERSDSSGLENPFCTVSSCIDLNSNDVKMDSNICSEEVILINTDGENTDS